MHLNALDMELCVSACMADWWHLTMCSCIFERES
jgi:hypothetical protein